MSFVIERSCLPAAGAGGPYLLHAREHRASETQTEISCFCLSILKENVEKSYCCPT